MALASHGALVGVESAGISVVVDGAVGLHWGPGAAVIAPSTPPTRPRRLASNRVARSTKTNCGGPSNEPRQRERFRVRATPLPAGGHAQDASPASGTTRHIPARKPSAVSRMSSTADLRPLGRSRRLVGRVPVRAGGIGRAGEDLVAEVVGEVQLAGEHAFPGVDHQVDVNGPAGIPTGIDRCCTPPFRGRRSIDDHEGICWGRYAPRGAVSAVATSESQAAESRNSGRGRRTARSRRWHPRTAACRLARSGSPTQSDTVAVLDDVTPLRLADAVVRTLILFSPQPAGGAGWSIEAISSLTGSTVAPIVAR